MRGLLLARNYLGVNHNIIYNGKLPLNVVYHLRQYKQDTEFLKTTTHVST